ncbi:hypothetical protein J6590_003805 [Homalodisca vitripennis]|nr:hypothetical protein J6590_003805 [Homalodisca vitripennis]
MIKFRGVLLRELIKAEDTSAPVPPLLLQQTGRKRPVPKHKLLKREGPARKSRKRCVQCYQEKVLEVGTKEARNKTKKVNTFCSGCPNEPNMCLGCFNKKH